MVWPIIRASPVAAILPPGGSDLNHWRSPSRGIIVAAPGLSTGRINRDANNVAPRFGFAWRLNQAGTTAVRGGYGMFSVDPCANDPEKLGGSLQSWRPHSSLAHVRAVLVVFRGRGVRKPA